jgi:hypothetical protein
MKNILKFLIIFLLLFQLKAEAQITLAESGVGVWRYFNLANPCGLPQTPCTGCAFGNYGGQPAGWNTCGFNDATWLTNYANLAVQNPGDQMWANETGGQVYGALFRTNFTLTSTTGTFFLSGLPNNTANVFINGIFITQLEWMNGMTTVCVPNNVMQIGNNCVAIQSTEWCDNSTYLRFQLYRDTATSVNIAQPNQTLCAGDPSTTFTATPTGGTWSGNGVTAAGVFTPSLSNVGINQIIYTYNIPNIATPCNVLRDTILVTVVDCCPDTCYWTKLGNNNVLATNFIGTKNNADFKIRTNNTEKMTVEANGNVGINNITPANKLEITQGTNGNSGLRFTNLPNTAPSIANPTNKVLSVNGTGDVILVDENGGGSNLTADQGITIDNNVIQLGDYCGNGGSPFQSHREITMNENWIYFNSGKEGRGYIGGDGCKELWTRWEIGTAGLALAINDYLSPNPSTSGLRFTNLTMNDNPIPNQSEGVLSLDQDGDVIWVRRDGNQNVGINNSCTNQFVIPRVANGSGDLECSQICDNGNTVTINQPTCTGRTFSVSGTYAMVSGNPANNTLATLDVNGLTFTNSLVVSSDKRLKRNVNKISNAMQTINKLNGVTYLWEDKKYPEKNLDNLPQAGFLAQDVEEIYPVSVLKDQNGFYAMNYNTFIPLLTEGQKELYSELQLEKEKNAQLQKDLISLSEKVEMLMEKVENCCASNQSKLINETPSTLFKVYPNPASKEITTEQFIPVNSKSAEILISDVTGRVIKRVAIDCYGHCNISTELPSSIQNNMIVCSLIIDGKVIASEKIAVINK